MLLYYIICVCYRAVCEGITIEQEQWASLLTLFPVHRPSEKWNPNNCYEGNKIKRCYLESVIAVKTCVFTRQFPTAIRSDLAVFNVVLLVSDPLHMILAMTIGNHNESHSNNVTCRYEDER